MFLDWSLQTMKLENTGMVFLELAPKNRNLHIFTWYIRGAWGWKRGIAVSRINLHTSHCSIGSPVLPIIWWRGINLWTYRASVNWCRWLLGFTTNWGGQIKNSPAWCETSWWQPEIRRENQLRLVVVSHDLTGFITIPGGARFLPSTVCPLLGRKSGSG